MKKISIKIILMNLLIFLVIFGSFFLISIQNLRSVITKQAENSLNEQINSWAKEYDNLFAVSSTFVLSFKAYLEDSLTLDILKDNEKSGIFFKEYGKIGTSTVKKANVVDIYCWLAPEYVDEIFGVSVQNFKLDGNVKAVNPGPYTRADITGDSWRWFFDTEKHGTNITKPYDWEGIDEPIISHTESLVIEGKTVGVVGQDLMVGTFQQRLLEKKILDTGYFALADENLEFIFHPEKPGENITKVFPTFSEEDFTTITQGSTDSGVLAIKDGSKIQLIAYKRLFNGWYLLGFPTTSEVYKSLNDLIRLMLIILIIAMVVVAIGAIIVGLSISRPLKEVAGNLEEIAKGGGDLTKTISVKSKDETSLLANNFNKFIVNLKGIVSNIKSSSQKSEDIGNSLNDSSANAATASEEISKNVTSIEKQINQLNDEIIRTTNGIEEIGSNISQFRHQIDDQVSAVEESSASVEEMIASLDNVSNVTNHKLESTKRLVRTTKQGESLLSDTSTQFKEGIADKIGSIKDMVEVISNISERTNLLAMNAAIEAAHAGEAGKGFAVVADEIRKMAEEASTSSSGISEIISMIVEAIQNTDMNVDNTSKAFKEILKEVNEIDVALNEIASNTIELASGGQEILKAVSLLNDTTSQISTGIGDIETGAKGINQAMDKVQNISSEVFSGVQEISYGVKDVSSSFTEVSTLAKELGEESKNLLMEVARFIIE